MKTSPPAESQLPSAARSWHCLAVEEVAAALATSTERGLDRAEAALRLARGGPNAIREPERRPAWRMLLDQFTDFMIVVLMAAAVVSGFIGEVADAVAILVIVVLNAVIGFVQEYRAERAMAALKKLAAASARVLRGGSVLEVAAVELVPGDVVLLEAGNVIPADLRLFETVVLKVEEAALTGESVPVEKQTAALPESDLPIGDRRNMAYKGTIVAYGRARGVVVATGMQTELGRIATLLSEEAEVRTPLQKRLAQFGRRLAVAALAACGAVFVFGVMRGEAIALMFLTAVSLAVAAIPEALPAVVTISLALGARKMAGKNALIRRLPAVEALGSVTYVCTDKTGTLTQNRMHVEELFIDGRRSRQWSRQDLEGGSARLLFQAMALNNDASIPEAGREIGDPTEIALLVAAREFGLEKDALEAESPRIAELPFDPERKLMTTVHRERHAGIVTYTKGAPERILDRCIDSQQGASPAALDRESVLETAQRMAGQGLRVIAVAHRRWRASPQSLTTEQVETGLTFIGLVGMIDPPRPEAQAAVETCKSAGIVPVMVTGDHPATARAIAARLGITTEEGRVVTGQQLARLTPEQFAEQVQDIHAYARVDPSQKIMIVSGLQAKGQFVAMTGDGVNDAPAIKRAEIGVAMGKIGTDVAREASSMVLLDDNFATIVVAVREGRRIYDNIRKFIRFVMGGNTGEIWTIAVAPVLGLPIPLVPIQILWINLVTDGLPGLALAAEREEPTIMRRPPRPPSESVFAHGMWQQILWVGILMGAICIGIEAWGIERGWRWQTMVFTALTLCQMYQVLAIRSERESIFTIGFLSNLPLLGAVLLTTLLQLAVIYVPWLNPVFKTQPLAGEELAVSVLVPSLVFVGIEIEKWMTRRGWLYPR